MTTLTEQDREILTLKAARMSTASIAAMVELSEAEIYNRLGQLDVTTVAQALERLAGHEPFSLAGWSAWGAPELAGVLRTCADLVENTVARVKGLLGAAGPNMLAAGLGGMAQGGPVAAAPALATVRIPAGETVVPRAVAERLPKARPAPASAPRPAPAASLKRIKAVTPSIARWAGHFLRARWPLAVVADLFDVAEDDLAAAVSA